MESKIFNNCNSETNGERLFYNSIKDKINIIFDIGCRNDSIFLDFKGDVHYFDPVQNFIEILKNQKNLNNKSFFNNFGLGHEEKELYYYPRYQSFYDRINSCKISDDKNKIKLLIKPASNYIEEMNIEKIDFIKIDTEGYELNVLKGFGPKLEIVKIIQFEYGGTFKDNNTKLIEIIEYLKQFGFKNFSYLSSLGLVEIIDYNDHYQFCNIVCFKD